MSKFITISCPKVGRQIVVLEDNEAIYKFVLEPLFLEAITKVFKKQQLELQDAMVDFEKDKELPNLDILQRNQFCA
jgi:hypothetical protein